MSWLWKFFEPAPRRPNDAIPSYTPDMSDVQSERVEFFDNVIEIYAFPSKGGVITLEHAEIVDFDYLGLDHLNPTGYKFDDQDREDELCQRMLLLGAKWWPSTSRRDSWSAYCTYYGTNRARLQPPEPDFNAQERLWISVGWPSTGGLWVAEYETRAPGIKTDDLPPGHLSQLRLARDMDERCHILSKWFDAEYYETSEDYDGKGCLKGWNQPKEVYRGALSVVNNNIPSSR